MMAMRKNEKVDEEAAAFLETLRKPALTVLDKLLTKNAGDFLCGAAVSLADIFAFNEFTNEIVLGR